MSAATSRAEFRVRVEPGAHRRAAQRQLAHVRQRRLDVRPRVRELRRIAGELLAERQRRRVLQMRAADLDDVGKGLGLRRQRRLERGQRRQQAARHRLGRGDVHRRREDVVRRLPAVDVVVGMHEPALAARPAEDLRGAIGEHLVDVHVRLRARSGLPDGERKFAGVTSRRAPSSAAATMASAVCCGSVPSAALTRARGSLDDQERPDQRLGHLLRRDPEVLERALRLRAPEPVGRDFDGSERVALDANGGIGHGDLRGGFVIVARRHPPMRASIACSSVNARPSCQARSKAASSPRPRGPRPRAGRSGAVHLATAAIRSPPVVAPPRPRCGRHGEGCRERRPPIASPSSEFGNRSPIAQFPSDRQALPMQRPGETHSRPARRPRSQVVQRVGAVCHPISRAPARSRGSPRAAPGRRQIALFQAHIPQVVQRCCDVVGRSPSSRVIARLSSNSARADASSPCSKATFPRLFSELAMRPRSPSSRMIARLSSCSARAEAKSPCSRATIPRLFSETAMPLRSPNCRRIAKALLVQRPGGGIVALIDRRVGPPH